MWKGRPSLGAVSAGSRLASCPGLSRASTSLGVSAVAVHAVATGRHPARTRPDARMPPVGICPRAALALRFVWRGLREEMMPPVWGGVFF